MRKHWLDNLRWGTVLLVLVYHVFYLYNASGVQGGLGPFSPAQPQDALLCLVYPWFMALLFLIAGVSSRYALEGRDARAFIKERTEKLLVPSTLGLLAFQWPVGYLYIKLGGGWDYIPAALRYPIAALSSTGPLWFIQLLWLFSLLLVLIKRADRDDRLWALGGKCGVPVLIGLFLPVWGASQVLNVPVVTVFRFGIYFFVFLLGYFVFSHDEVQARVERMHLPLLAAALILGAAYVWRWHGQDYTSDECLKSLFTGVYLWAAVLAALGCGKAWLDKTSPFAAYMTRASFGIYIVHYIVALYACWALKSYTALPVPAIYVLAVAAVLLLSPALYELVRRVPGYRWLVLGVRGKKRAQ